MTAEYNVMQYSLITEEYCCKNCGNKSEVSYPLVRYNDGTKQISRQLGLSELIFDLPRPTMRHRRSHMTPACAKCWDEVHKSPLPEAPKTPTHGGNFASSPKAPKPVVPLKDMFNF